MSQFRQFWIDDVNSYVYRNGINCCANEIHVIEIAALEAAQKEIAELKDSNEDIRSHLLSQTKISNQLLNEKEQLTAALKVAEDALDRIAPLNEQGAYQAILAPRIAMEAKEEIQKIKKGLG